MASAISAVPRVGRICSERLFDHSDLSLCNLRKFSHVAPSAEQESAGNPARVHGWLVFGPVFPRSISQVARGKREWAKEWKGKGMRIEEEIGLRCQEFPCPPFPCPFRLTRWPQGPLVVIIALKIAAASALR